MGLKQWAENRWNDAKNIGTKLWDSKWKLGGAALGGLSGIGGLPGIAAKTALSLANIYSANAGTESESG